MTDRPDLAVMMALQGHLPNRTDRDVWCSECGSTATLTYEGEIVPCVGRWTKGAMTFTPGTIVAMPGSAAWANANGFTTTGMVEFRLVPDKPPIRLASGDTLSVSFT